MNPSVPYVCPYTGEELILQEGKYISTSERVFEIIQDIPRFCSVDNYSKNFGIQWNLFDKTQLDSYCKINLSHNRFWAETSWDPKSLEGLNILEVGSGAGRFSEVFLKSTNCKLYSIDYSEAVEANFRNNKIYKSRLILSQASIYQMPFRDNSFDKVFCLGVLQHTPSFEESISALVSKVKINGEIVVDFYPYKGFYTKINAKYILRIITKRLPKNLLLFLIKKSISLSLFVFNILKKVKLNFLIRFLPLTDIRTFPKSLSQKQIKEWAIMDTFDALSPEYDNPQRLSNVVRIFEEKGCDITFAGEVNFKGGFSTVVRAIKKI